MQWQARNYGSDDDFDMWCKRRRRICWASGSFRYTALGRIILGRVPEAQLAALSVLLTLEDVRKKNYFGAKFDEDERAGSFRQFPYDILASMCGG